MKNRIYIVPLFVVIVFSMMSCNEESIQSTLEVLKADQMKALIPNIDMQTAQDKKINIHDAVSNKIALISIWKSFCPPCKRDVPKLLQMQQKLMSKNKDILTVLHIAQDTDTKAVIEFKKEMGIVGDVIMDPQGTTFNSTTLKTRGTPTTFLVNMKGEIIAQVLGTREWDSEEIIKSMHSLVQFLKKHKS